MGGCASSSAKNSDSKMMTKLRLVFATAHKEDTMIISSPIKDKPSISGSKDEAFFDSKAWLDSDCDDDFFSVKGDFTPSRGNTPVHHNFSIGTPQVNKSLFNESTSEPSPNTRKRLSELFEESLREDEEANFEGHKNEAEENIKLKNKTTTPKNTTTTTPLSSERLSKKNTIKSVQCCLPNMLSSRSFSERSKMSPVQSVW